MAKPAYSHLVEARPGHRSNGATGSLQTRGDRRATLWTERVLTDGLGPPMMLRGVRVQPNLPANFLLGAINLSPAVAG